MVKLFYCNLTLGLIEICTDLCTYHVFQIGTFFGGFRYVYIMCCTYIHYRYVLCLLCFFKLFCTVLTFTIITDVFMKFVKYIVVVVVKPLNL